MDKIHGQPNIIYCLALRLGSLTYTFRLRDLALSGFAFFLPSLPFAGPIISSTERTVLSRLPLGRI